MSQWEEEYKRFPNIREYHLRQLARLEAGESIDFIMHIPSLTVVWINIAIIHDKQKACSTLLDCLNVSANLSFKQRVAFFQLGI